MHPPGHAFRRVGRRRRVSFWTGGWSISRPSPTAPRVPPGWHARCFAEAGARIRLHGPRFFSSRRGARAATRSARSPSAPPARRRWSWRRPAARSAECRWTKRCNRRSSRAAAGPVARRRRLLSPRARRSCTGARSPRAIHALKNTSSAKSWPALGALFEAVERPRAELVCPLPLAPVPPGPPPATIKRRCSRVRRRGGSACRSSTCWCGPGRRRRKWVAIGAPARNVAGAFRATGEVRGRSICLVDDVLTTGATAGRSGARPLCRGRAESGGADLSRAP